MAEVASLFGKSKETIRRWLNNYEDYLSPGANPGDGKPRRISEEDLSVLALANEQLARGQSNDEVLAALANGSRSVPPQTPQSITPETTQLAIFQLHKEMNQLRIQITEYEMKLGIAEDRASRAESQLESERAEFRDRIERLNREIGRLEARLEAKNDTDN